MRRLRRVASRIFLAAAFVFPMLEPSSSQAQVALPIHVPAATLNDLVSSTSFIIDLGTLPTRPQLVARVTPDASHPDMELEIQAIKFIDTPTSPGACPEAGRVVTSAPAVGANQLVVELWKCDPRPGAFAGGSVEIAVRAVSFGSTPGPANVEIDIRGETLVPTATLISTVNNDLTPQTLVIEAWKDTVLYGSNSAYSNGAGWYLWAGMDVSVVGIPPLTITVRRRLNSLMAFQFIDEIPFNAQVTDAALTLWAWEVLNGGGTVSLYQTAPSAAGQSWNEGDADAAGNEFIGTASTSIAANWNYRQTTAHPWTTPGGDTTGPLLQSKSITGAGSQILSSPNLTAAVQGLVDVGVDDPYAADDGFILLGPYSPFILPDTGIRFTSSDYPTAFYRPTLTIDYTPTEPYSDSRLNEDWLQTGVVSFISEGDNMRWIYDLDHDDILETDIGGICEIHADTPNYLPYTYAYTGAPSYTGVDCCAWQIDSVQTGTVGTGQALFFHNLDPGVPSNMPPDTDGDGILDNCDNCLNVPNGPFLGSCRSASGVSGTCHADADCATGEICDQSQIDTDENFIGDVCDVPEPGLAIGLASGIAFLVGLRRRRLA